MKVIHMGFLGCVSPNCLQVFEREEDLEHHKSKVHHKEEKLDNKYACGQCGREFNKFTETGVRRKFDNHMRIHKEEDEWCNKYHCAECGKVFNKFTETGVRQKFDKHMRIHKVLGFKCECPNIPTVTVSETGQKGARIGKLFLIKEQHMMVQHENKYGCEDCINYFETAEELKRHMSSHSTYLCLSCNKKVNIKRMTDHRRQHEVDPCQCLKCGKAFTNKHFLSNHLLTHISEVCPDCGGTFRRLKEHITKKHQLDGEKKFHCNQCGKGLVTKFMLNSHMMSVHLKLQPHQCRYGCENRYNDVNNRAAHERKRHGGIFTRRNE